MEEEKLKFCLVIDTEGFSMFNDYHPRWKFFDKVKFNINYLIRNFRYNEKGFYDIYEYVKKEKFPVSFMLVGSLFSPISKESFIDWGYHTFNHKRLTTLSDEELKKEIKNTYEYVSFSAPMWFIEEKKNPQRVCEFLKKENYKIFLYRGNDDEIISMNHHCKISSLFEKYGLKAVNTSNVFDGSSKRKKIESIKKQILENLDNNVIYCLQTHDFSHKNMSNFKEIISFTKNLEKQKKLNIVNLSNLAYERY